MTTHGEAYWRARMTSSWQALEIELLDIGESGAVGKTIDRMPPFLREMHEADLQAERQQREKP
jgi:hypothetical protein